MPLSTRMEHAVGRRLSRWFARRPFPIRLTTPLVSFTFDDFPRSALVNGGRILERHGATGTYYASLGLAGRATATGEIFHVEDLEPLRDLGHELGCHTFSHCPAWETEPAAYEAALRRNTEALHQLLPAAAFRTHSYPISHPHPDIKRVTGRHFLGCRAGGQTFNAGTADLNHLNGFFIEQSRDDFTAIQDVIAANARACGWLIFATHDIADNPTRFGCTPELFEQVVRATLRSGARILPVTRALAVIAAGSPAPVVAMAPSSA